jgi:hypothetical protein
MFGSEILEVAVGLFFVYLILSLVSSAVREWIESMTKSRATDLARGVALLLQNPKLTEAVYNHPLVGGLYEGEYQPPEQGFRLFPGRSKLPSYIPAGNFALALMDIVVRGTDYSDRDSAGPDTPFLSLASVRDSVGSIPDPWVRRAILTAVDRAEGDFTRAQANLEAWYNSAMDRVSGTYKRRTQLYLLMIGLGMTIVMNVNTLAVAEHLYRNDTAREVIVARAESATAEPGGAQGAGPLAGASVEQLTAELDSLDLPIGWKVGWPGVAPRHPDATSREAIYWWERALSPLLGWLLTAFAVSLGAPFWFDMLNKFMVVRSTVKPHEKSGEEGSEDRKAGGAPPPHLGGSPPYPGAAPVTPLAGEGVRGGLEAADPSVVHLPAGVVAAGFEPHQWEQGDPEEGLL